MIDTILNLDAYPLHEPKGAAYRDLVRAKRADWQERGAFRLPGLIRTEMVGRAAEELKQRMDSSSFRHRHNHNIYFTDDTDGLPDGLAAKTLTTSHRTLTCDQMAGSIIRAVYEWDPLCRFLQTVLELPALYRMADPMAGLNVMAYGDGDGLDWHFDRAKFAVTILLQAPAQGGAFEYCRNIRSMDDPNHKGVQALLDGGRSDVQSGTGDAGDMTVFAGFRSAHRVAPVIGEKARMMAVLSFMEEPNYSYGPEDLMRFYGRTEPDNPEIPIGSAHEPA